MDGYLWAAWLAFESDGGHRAFEAVIGLAGLWALIALALTLRGMFRYYWRR